MEALQHTLKKSVSFKGIGLHSGYPVNLTVRPAEANHGIRFKISGSDHSMPAFFDRIVDTSLATTIAEKDMIFSTTEHLLGALTGLGIDNALVELNAPELPIMDGSAESFVNDLQKVRRKAQNSKRQFIKITEEIQYTDGDKLVRVLPHDGLRLTCKIDFKHSLIQNQSYSIEVSPETFSKEIASARTFGFLDQVEKLQQSGYALGGSLDNAVVVDRNGVMNEGGLRFEDEFARHKILDLLGDITLLGCPVLGHIIASKSGHGQHFGLMREILSHPDCWQLVELQETAESGIMEKLVNTTRYAGNKLKPFLTPQAGFADAACTAAA
ncbi:MAG: UDP-3-O-acyl-N-acetylglucosamine deacetylase [Deltaproteobacteria bacterium]|nr:UDP-3-O-acyl-N-acetylglucosamine deacetylase [Deltaproteobacteria bacterium]